MEKRIAITGGSGFIGANLARFLAGRGHSVELLLRPEYKTWRLDGLKGKIKKHVCRLENREETKMTLRRISPDWVFHLAAHGAYSWQRDTGEMVATNVISTLNLLEATEACGATALINAGSSSEYGPKRSAPTERAGINPNSAYAATKACATMLCRMAGIEKNLKVTTLRLYSAYGPWEDPGRLMPTLIEQGLKGEWPPLVSPEISRDFVWVEDVCEAFLLAGERPHPPGAVFNIGTGRGTKMVELAQVAKRILDLKGPPEWGTMPDREWDTTTWVADPRLAKKVLGWEAKVPLKTGLEKLKAWHQKRERLKYFDT